MTKPNYPTRYFAESVRYGGLLVSRYDMERHLNDCGVTGPARLHWALSERIPHPPEAEYLSPGWRIIATGQLLP